MRGTWDARASFAATLCLNRARLITLLNRLNLACHIAGQAPLRVVCEAPAVHLQKVKCISSRNATRCVCACAVDKHIDRAAVDVGRVCAVATLPACELTLMCDQLRFAIVQHRAHVDDLANTSTLSQQMTGTL
jgi:hypothetical protein